MSVERAARNAGWFFGAHMVRRLVHLAYPLYVARKLGPETLGNYFFLLALVAMLTMLSSLGLGMFLIRRTNRDPEGAEDVIANCYSFNYFSATIAMVGMLSVAPLMGDTKWPTVIMAFAVVPIASRAMMSSVATAYENLWILALVDNGGAIVEAIVGVALVALGFQLPALCVLYLVLSVLTNTAFRLLLRSRGIVTRPRLAPREWPSYLRESWKFWAATANRAIYNHVGPVLLRAISGAAKVGYFGLAMTAYEVIRAAAEAFNSAVFPFMIRAWHRSAEELRAFHESTLRLLLFAGVPVGFLGLLLSGPVIGQCFPKYVESVPVLQILAWFLYLHFYEEIAIRVCHASGRLLLPVLAHTVINGVSLALSVVFIMRMVDKPQVGLAWARLLAVGFSFLVYTVLIRRYIYDLNPLASLSRTLAASAVPTLMAIFLDGKIHVALLTPMALAAFLIGAWALRLLTSREIHILRRALHLAGPPGTNEPAPPSEDGEVA